MLKSKYANKSVTNGQEFRPIHVAAWKMILRASTEERQQMSVDGTPARRKVKREVMAYLHEPYIREFMNQPIEAIVDAYLEQAKHTPTSNIEPGQIISKEEAEYIELVHRRTQIITLQKI